MSWVEKRNDGRTTATAARDAMDGVLQAPGDDGLGCSHVRRVVGLVWDETGSRRNVGTRQRRQVAERHRARGKGSSREDEQQGR